MIGTSALTPYEKTRTGNHISETYLNLLSHVLIQLSSVEIVSKNLQKVLRNYDLKGVVDKINDAVELFTAHIRTQGGRKP